MLFRAGRKKHKIKEIQRQIGFKSSKVEDNGLFEKSDDFPGFAFKVDKEEKAEFHFTGKVVIPLKLYQKMFLYATNITKEISGLGMVERLGNELHITDLFIVKQEVTAGNTTLDNKALAEKTLEIINAGGDPSKMKFWWHSHANGGVFWSATDEKCCEAYNNDQWLLSIVVNHKKEIRCRLDIYNPIRITLDNMPVVIEEPVDYLSKLEEECKKDMKSKVREPATSFNYGANVTQRKSGYWKCSKCDFTDPDIRIAVKHMTRVHNYASNLAWNEVKWLEEENEYGEEQPAENIDKDTPSDVFTGSFEDIYNENHNMEFTTLSFRDTFGIFWTWDATEQQYNPMWGKRILKSKEYAFIADALAQGIKIDKDCNVVV